MKTKIIAIALLLFSSQAWGAYPIVGVGKAVYHRNNGIWVQDGYSNQYQQQATAWSLGVGQDITHWFSIEADYRDLGHNRVFAAWESDASYGARLLGKDVTDYGYTDDSLRMVAVSAVLSYPRDGLRPFVRAGLTHYRLTHALYQRKWWDDHATQVGEYACSIRRNGYLLGVGLEYKRLRIEMTRYGVWTGDGSSTCNANFTQPMSVLISYKF